MKLFVFTKKIIFRNIFLCVFLGKRIPGIFTKGCNQTDFVKEFS